jgi:hypothetical protein
MEGESILELQNLQGMNKKMSWKETQTQGIQTRRQGPPFQFKSEAFRPWETQKQMGRTVQHD